MICLIYLAVVGVYRPVHFRQRSMPVSCGAAIQPAQPIVQDPSMPLLTPPDPGTQLEEARRRLQLEATTRIPPKSLQVSRFPMVFIIVLWWLSVGLRLIAFCLLTDRL